MDSHAVNARQPFKLSTGLIIGHLTTGDVVEPLRCDACRVPKLLVKTRMHVFDHKCGHVSKAESQVYVRFQIGYMFSKSLGEVSLS